MLNKASLSLILGVLLIGLTSVSADNDLDALCQNKPIELSKITQAQSLIQQSKQDPSGVCAKYQSSLNDLEDILSFVQSGKICDLELVDKIRRYQLSYLVESGVNQAPLAIRQFFLALGFQISAECKIVMINNFETDITSRISESDYEIFNLLENNGANPLIGEVVDYDDIVLPKEFNISGEESEPVKLLVKVQTGNLIQRLTKECRSKFKPIYDKLIMPLIELSNLGYNYQGEMLERELLEFRQNKLIHRWYSILQTCEAFELLSIFEDPNNDSSVERRAITLISKAEAEKMVPVNLPSEGAEPTVIYEPPISHNSDELWILSKDSELDKLIAKRQTSATEADRIRSKIIRKLLNRVKEALKSGEIISGLKNGFSGFADQLKPFMEGEEVVLAVDGAVSANDGNDLDTPVSGKRPKKGKAPPINSLTYNIPPRPTFIPKAAENGSRTSTWLWDNTIGRAAPSRRHIFMYILMGLAILVVVIAALHMAG